MTPWPSRLGDLALSAQRGGFVLRTPFRRHSRTIAQSRELALKLVAWLRREGIAPGTRAILWGPSGPDWAAAFLGCMLEGVVVVPLEDAAGAAFAARVQREAKAPLAFVGRAAIAHAAESLPGARVVVLEDLVAMVERMAPAAEATLPELGDDTLLEIVFTSGTTSEPKGVLLTHGNVLTILRAIGPPYRRWNARVGWLVRRRPVLTLLPLSHMFGQVVGVFVPLMMGLTSVFVSPQGPPAIREALKEEGAWVVMSVPRFLGSLRRHVEEDLGIAPSRLAARAADADGSWAHRLLAWHDVRRRLGWRFAAWVVGGAALDRDEEMAWRGMGYLVAQGYGLTETAPIVTLSNPFAKGAGRVGRPLHGQEVRLSPEGEVLVRGGNVTTGYVQGGVVTPVVDAEGWFHTGDLGELDERGRLRIVGRSKDVIVTPEGLNVHARDVEVVLARDARVREAAVVGMPGEGGEHVHAVLVLSGEARAAEGDAGAAIVQSANAQLAPYQRVRAWTVWQGADLPRTPATGKVKKRDLIAAIAGGSHASAAATGSEDALETAMRALQGSADGAGTLADLGLSSLETVELVSRLEGEYQVVIDEARVRPDMTLKELGALVTTNAGGAPPVRVDMPRWARASWARWVGAGLRATLAYPATAWSFRPFTVTGREHVTAVDGPVLFVGNHASYLDAPAFFRALPAGRRNRIATATATEPFHPLFTREGTAAQRAWQAWRYVATVLAFGGFPLPRSSGFRASIEYAGELVDHGFSVLIFPEGRMSPDGEIQAFRGGAGIIARELRVPVVPFRIRGIRSVLPPGGGWWPAPGPVSVTFGPALRFPAEASAEECVRRMEEAVRAT